MEKTMSDIFHKKSPNFRQAGKMSSFIIFYEMSAASASYKAEYISEVYF